MPVMFRPAEIGTSVKASSSKPLMALPSGRLSFMAFRAIVRFWASGGSFAELAAIFVFSSAKAAFWRAPTAVISAVFAARKNLEVGSILACRFSMSCVSFKSTRSAPVRAALLPPVAPR